MKTQILYLILIIFSFFLFCIQENNPYYQKENIKVITELKSFSNGKNINIFSTETITVAPLLSFQIDSFTVAAKGNRYFSDDHITIIKEDSLKNRYTFKLSFSDTGYKEITITTFHKDSAIYKEQFNLSVSSPLKQKNFHIYYGDTITLSTPPVSDENVFYNWDFLNSTMPIITHKNSINKPLHMIAMKEKGILYITDFQDSSIISPLSHFTYSVIDTIKPTITYIHNDSISNDTIRTGDSLLIFEVEVRDQGETAVDTTYLSIQNSDEKTQTFNAFHFSYPSNNNYKFFFYDIYQHSESSPMKVTVYARDNTIFKNKSQKTFWLCYDTSIQQTNRVDININNVTTTTTTANYKIFGSVFNPTGKDITLEALLDSISDTNKITISGTMTTEKWYWKINLKEGSNLITILAKDSQNNTLAKKQVSIYYNPSSLDSSGPLFWEITVDNNPGLNNHFYVKNTKAFINIIAFDILSTIHSLTINGTPIIPTDPLHPMTYSKTIDAPHSFSNSAIALYAEDSHKNITTKNLTIIQNTVPYMIDNNLRDSLLSIRYSFRDTIKTKDMENDNVIIEMLHISPWWEFTNNLLVFNPNDSIPLISDSLCFRIKDMFQFSDSIYTWRYRLIDSINTSDTVNFSSSMQNKISNTIFAEQDSISISLDVENGTSPYYFSASIPKLNKTFFVNSQTDSVLSWIPSKEDTGSNLILYLKVTDAKNTHDTFIYNFDIYLQEDSGFSVNYTLDPDSIINITGDTIDLKDSVNAHIYFTITPNSNTSKETYTATISTINGLSEFDIDSLSDKLGFLVTINPIINRKNEFVIVTIKNSNDSTYKKEFHIIHPKYTTPIKIDSLIVWFDATKNASVIKNDISKIPCNNKDSVYRWQNQLNLIEFAKASSGYYPVYDSIPGYQGIHFNRSINEHDCMTMQNHADWPNSSFTIIIVAKLNQYSTNNYYTLISSSSATESFNLGLNNGIAIFSRSGKDVLTSSTDLYPIHTDSLFIISYSSTGIGTSNAVVGINGNKTTLTNVTKVSYNTSFMIGANRTDIKKDGWDGNISEILFYKKTLTDIEYGGIIQYLSKKHRVILRQ